MFGWWVWVLGPRSGAMDNQVPEHCRHLICLPVGTRGRGICQRQPVCQSAPAWRVWGCAIGSIYSHRWVTLPLSPPRPLETIPKAWQSAFSAGQSLASQAVCSPETLVSLAGSAGTWSLLLVSHGRLMRNQRKGYSCHLVCRHQPDACFRNDHKHTYVQTSLTA